MLNPLDWEEIEKFLKIKLGKNKDEFLEEVGNNKTIDLLSIPFYLKFLVVKYKLDKKLPRTRYF